MQRDFVDGEMPKGFIQYTYYCRDVMKDGRMLVGFWRPGEYVGELYDADGNLLGDGHFHENFKPIEN